MKNFMLLWAFSLLLFGCDKKWPNRLTPKELEIDASEHDIVICTTRKINDVDISNESYPNTNPGDSNYDNGILTFEESWFNMRVNKNHPDSCYIIKFHIKKNDLGKKRKVVFYVQGDIHTKTTGGSITQNAQ